MAIRIVGLAMIGILIATLANLFRGQLDAEGVVFFFIGEVILGGGLVASLGIRSLWNKR